jgi:6-pyruvoyl-tetrahydropterin synthase related domain
MKRALTILDVVLLLACVAGLARVIAMTGLHVPLDPNEGWNAYHTLAAMSGAPLYPPAGSFLDNNYPPLSYYIVGAVGWLTGDEIVAGRIVSLLSLLAVAAGIFVSARRMGVSSEASLFGVLWFVLGLLVFTDYVGMDDPQLLGHAVAMAGFVLLLRGNVFAAALAMTLALFVKHNLVALPLAALVWLALTDRKAALRFAGYGIGFCLLGLILFRLVYGVNLWAVLASPRLYSLDTLRENVAAWTVWDGLGAAVMASLLLVRRGDRDVALCAIYAFAAVLIGLIFAGGAGVDMNVWFDAAIALSLGSALAIGRFERDLHKALAASAYVLALGFGLALNWDDVWDRPQAADSEIAFLKAHPGPALCETLSLCYWAGKRAEVDVFNTGQAFAAGARSDAALIRLIVGRRYRAMEFDSMDDFALGPRVKQAVLSSYRVDHESDDGTFLVPR